ncbi:O-phosphoserine--tRNA ligase [Methanospirillum sp. J.3.6.1-F.2.7.3]|uniref:O-phosphoserine--tRNA(Cys) ligase n=1 Tax=Methanospirillum purgamenti TaxID=2834276 RepID=A0A8E7EHL3_9EURY|nr:MULTISPECIES: O-phosphoserine--tRNA ligase [Methanospirillum]MDX8551416.1 O-phosphoserine--tRNA ligase [Methanospirillum hungatei]QVV89458.1 O-phosphoserine--tRNA ligase [Methanospirillum sp. J.3.6.1-F.2.7.3]
MIFDIEEFKKRGKEDFESAWHTGPSVLTPPTTDLMYPRLTYPGAQVHPVFETIHRLRQAYLAIGFDEAENPIIVDEKEVYRQFGPEAMAVLDRVFYLGGLPRPNVGIGKEQIQKINGILGRDLSEEEEESLRKTLHAYKKSEIDGDELTHELSAVLHTDDARIVEILDQVFPEFRELKPESSRQTLRSHMTSGWFQTLGSIWEKVPHPIRLFSIDRCFRREQAEDSHRLMSYHSASCVVAGEHVTIEDGKAVARALLSAFGYTDFEFRPDDKRSKYYMPDTQTEVYAAHPDHGWVEVATFGIYSPVALAEYGIGVPVMNLGLGVERMAMIMNKAKDVRELCFPQFFPIRYTDTELAAGVSLLTEPATTPGKNLVRSLIDTAVANSSAIGPCSFVAFEGEIAGKQVRVYVEEPEENAKLLGPACMNEIFVYNGAILGVPDTEKFAEVRKNGISTGITYLFAVTSQAAAEIEQAAHFGIPTSVQIKMARLPGDINLKIEPWAMRYITDNNLKTDVRGPVFLTIRSEIVSTSEEEKPDNI